MKFGLRSALKFITLSFSGVLAVTCLISCTPWRKPVQPATLVIFIESLGFNSFSCGDSTGSTAGNPEEVLFEGFCRESVRFTHAYAPSPMSQPTVASVLTGLYPLEHGVRHNGPLSLSAKYETVAEVAKEKGYRTSFFSGGPPIFRRSGFNQGVDQFDDNTPVSLKQLYRPASQVVDLFLSWQKSASGASSPFLSFLFFPDPQFVDQPTTNELGEVRESSYQSQVIEVSESLNQLVREMKARKIWDTTNVILIGLNGFVSDTRSGEPGAVNLFFESTRATLMMKPARKMKEGPYNWKIDSNVSLVDVGTTLFKMLGHESTEPRSKLATVSLEKAMQSPTPDWDSDRKIVIETAWPVWKAGGATRAALRKGPYFYLFDENDQLYNTLTDSLEVSPLLLADPSVTRLRDDFAGSLRDLGYVPWKSRSQDVLLKSAKTLLAQDLWRDRQLNSPLTPDLEAKLNKLSKRYSSDRELVGWRANLALLNGNWTELKKLSVPDRPAWAYVADLNLDPKKKVEPLSDLCHRALFSHQGEVGKNCGDVLSRDLALWTDEKADSEARNRAMEAFLKGIVSKSLNDKVARADMIAGDVWDVSKGRWAEPSIVDLMLAMPDFKKYRATVRAKIASESR